MFRRTVLSLAIAACGVAVAASAQQQPMPAGPQTSTAPITIGTVVYAPGEPHTGATPHYVTPETPEQRKERLGTQQDPGPDPDPKTLFYRFGKTFHIEKFDRRFATFEGAEHGQIRPYAFANIYKEIYQLNDEFVWCWIEEKPIVKPDVPEDNRRLTKYNKEEMDYFQKMRGQFSTLDVPESAKTLTFTASSDGLPTSGSWRNSVALADMNGDGFLDIVAPPQRGGNGIPAIFLGDGKGHWKFWETVQWPHGVDYGSVVAADFNKDGKMDLAFGVHLTGINVFYGDGKGHFTETAKGLPNDFGTRRLAVADVDRDGWPDIVAVSEGPTTSTRPAGAEPYAKLRVYYNRDHGKRFEGQNVSPVDNLFGGDWVTVGNFNGDKYPDFAAASVFFNGTDILYASDGPKKWKTIGERGKAVQFLGYHWASAAGHFSSKSTDDLLLSYVRSWPTDIDPRIIPDPSQKQIVGIDRISFSGGEAKQTPLVRWPGTRGVWGMVTADFDGDGNMDVAYTRYDPRELVILLGDGKGGFRRAKVEGIKLPTNTNYDLQVADVNKDGRPDLVICFESSSTSRFGDSDGSIAVWLNGGTSPASAK